MRTVRNHLSYANVMATLAVFLVLGGGTALASYVVSSNGQVGPNTISGHKPPTGEHSNIIGGSVNAQDLAPGAVTPPKLDAVAEFRQQDSATTASYQQVLSKGGLTVRYRCDDDSGDLVPRLVATSSVQHAAITMGFTTGSDGFGSSFYDLDRDFNSGEIFDLSHSRQFGEGTAVYSTPDGRVLTLNYGFQNDPCLAHGVAIQG